MTNIDQENWDREVEHAEKMQKQRKTKTITFAGGHTYEIEVKDEETSDD